MAQNLEVAPGGAFLSRRFVFRDVYGDIAAPTTGGCLGGFIRAAAHICNRTYRHTEHLCCVGGAEDRTGIKVKRLGGALCRGGRRDKGQGLRRKGVVNQGRAENQRAREEEC